MGKKKPFIDKKTASVYHVVRRSQRDVGTEATAETLSDFVLMPSPDNAVKEQQKAREEKLQRAEAEAATKQGGNKHEGGMLAGAKRGSNKKVDFNTLKSQIAAAGLLDTTSATYSKYTKPIESTGLFVPSNILHEEDATNLSSLFTDTSKNTLDTALQEAMEVHEVGRMLDSIALTADCMEEDMAHALFDDFEDGEFEEILDDFCLTANQEELEVEDENEADKKDDGEFNFEQHIQALMEKARIQEAGGEAGRELEDDFFTGVTPLHGRIEEEDEEDDFDYDQYGEEDEEDSLDREFNGQDDGGEDEEDSLDREFSGKDYSTSKPNVAGAAAAATSSEQQRILTQKFEEALLEYDSDDVGDLDEECEDIVGDRPLEGDKQLEAALNEFLTDKKDEILIEGTKKNAQQKRTGGSGYSALVGTTMVNQTITDLNNNDEKLRINMEESKKQMEKDLADADAILANPEMDLPPEEVFIDGKSYFSVSSRNPWDCESILSTYSNLDNNPVVIGRKKKKKGKKGKNKGNPGGETIPEEGPVKIQLSNKTGLPIGVFDKEPQHQPEDEYYDDYYGEGDTYLSINRGEARNKQETKAEKKERKMAIKEERKICRMQKKIMKEAFKEEFQKRGHDVVVDAVGGNTVFRFS